jgi:hypothetical protein
MDKARAAMLQVYERGVMILLQLKQLPVRILLPICYNYQIAICVDIYKYFMLS